MGIWDSLKKAFGMSGPTVNILLLGLDNSGKTTILNKLKPGGGGAGVAPTVGFVTDSFQRDNIKFSCYDMSGQEKYRHLWEQCYASAEAIIFVLDSDDRIRMCIAKDELLSILNHSDIKNRRVPILFFANKMDLPSAMTSVECTVALALSDIKDKPWHITSSNGLTGEGLDEGISWLIDAMKK